MILWSAAKLRACQARKCRPEINMQKTAVKDAKKVLRAHPTNEVIKKQLAVVESTSAQVSKCSLRHCRKQSEAGFDAAQKACRMVPVSSAVRGVPVSSAVRGAAVCHAINACARRKDIESKHECVRKRLLAIPRRPRVGARMP
jgi:hypothetical protein